jgi:hypothetical protein
MWTAAAPSHMFITVPSETVTHAGCTDDATTKLDSCA